MSNVECLSLNPAIDVASQCDSVRPTHKIRLDNQLVYPGGGAINVARVIKLMGGSASLTCVVGGVTGDILSNGLSQLGIPCTSIASAVDTRISFTVRDKKTGLEYRFIPKGEPLASSVYNKVVDKICTPSPDVLVLSGSLPTGASNDIYARIASATFSQGTLVFVDCSGPALAATLESKSVFLAKPSLSELEQLAGKKLSESAAIKFASALVDSGSAVNIAVSMGQNGAFLVNNEGVLRAPAVKVSVRSAVGAGDSFLAAIVHRLTCKDTMKNAFRWGMAAGAAAVTTNGTTLCELGVLNRLVDEVRIVRE